MNRFSSPKGTIILVVGDITIHVFSLIISLAIRYGEIPTRTLLADHVPSFLILWACFILVSFIAGLYDKRIGLIQTRITGLLLSVQVINTILGIMFFYFAPVGIAPKANLFIYFLVSTGMLFLWRMVMFPVFSISRKQDAVLIGDGEAIVDLNSEINAGFRYGFVFKEHVTTKATVAETVEALSAAVKRTDATIIVADLNNRTVESTIPFLYSLIFSGIQIVDASRLYESVFDRIPLSMVRERWLIEHSSMALGIRYIYDTVKRLMDIFVAGILGLISLIFYPIVYVAIKLDDGGPLFVTQERVGKNNATISMAKFRSMTSNDSGSYHKNGGKTTLKVTRVGKFIRLTRIDELPQLWSVIKGDQSLIGPRPELPALTKVYEEQIPYYNARHLIKPGLSGWAQISHHAHPHHAVAVNDTRDKLSYDLFYVKNRSLLLDLRIALQTLKALISRQGV
jgi:lipopolysaccharide/colanic/teichoic acid biosynthesis glycosyltransferase